MKLNIFGIESTIEFRQGFVSVLEIENKPLFKRVVFGLCEIYNGQETNLNISIENNGTIERLSNFELVTDVLNMDLSTSQTKLNKYILSALENEKETYNAIYNEMININSKLMVFLDDMPFNLCYKEIEMFDLIKNFNFKLNFKAMDNCLESVLNFLKVVQMLKISNFIIFVDLKKYFDDKELNQIYAMINILDIKVLLIESSISNQLQPNEWKLSIDKDLYESTPLKL